MTVRSRLLGGWRRSLVRGRSRAGFLLLEALVAVGIMAFVLSVLPAGVVLSRKSVQKSADVVAARLVAEAVLTNEFGTSDFEPGTKRGTLDGYEWATLAKPNDKLANTFKSREWTPFDVIVQINIPEGRLVTLETIRLRSGK